MLFTIFFPEFYMAQVNKEAPIALIGMQAVKTKANYQPETYPTINPAKNIHIV